MASAESMPPVIQRVQKPYARFVLIRPQCTPLLHILCLPSSRSSSLQDFHLLPWFTYSSGSDKGLPPEPAFLGGQYCFLLDQPLAQPKGWSQAFWEIFPLLGQKQGRQVLNEGTRT